MDALGLFKRMNNQKAIGVAYNNLGNTLFLLFKEMKNDGVNSKYGLELRDVIRQGISCFHDAIKLGERAYDEFYNSEGW